MIRAFQWDLARQVERLDFLKKLLPRYGAWGYSELYLHLEDAVHYPSLPGIGRDDAYSYEELGELVLCAARNGIRVVPIINLLGHTQYLIKHPELRDLNELRDERGRALPQGQICPLHPRTLEIARKLLSDMAPYCTAGKVHVGLDESFHLGKCPRCRDEVSRIGLERHFAGHVNQLYKAVDGMGLQMGMWADMLYFVPKAIPMLPRGITAYDWYYYPFNRKPRVEFFNFAERDLYPALKRQGVRYYGCPMNGAFRHEPLPVFGDRLANIRSWWHRCQTVKADGMLITSWEAGRMALESTTLVDAAAASLWLEPDQDDATTLLANGLRRSFGSTQARKQARQLLAADELAFTGYARWQINDRWDVLAGNESLKPYLRELSFFAKLRAEANAWPAALAASLAFRLYLAQRDVFVRQAARNVFLWRRLLAKGEGQLVRPHMQNALVEAGRFALALKEGKKAARAMWTRTRSRLRQSTNEALLDDDRRRLEEWRTWLQMAKKQPEQVAGPTPVCGAWQLQLMVHNFAPAAQKIIVEQQNSAGNWQELVSRYTIEFRAQAARPSSKIKRELSLPLEGPDTKIRFRTEGVGQLAVSQVHLTNGIRRILLSDYQPRRVLGRPAPKRGLPYIP